MTRFHASIIALLAFSFAPASAQVRAPVSGVAAVQHAPSGAQANQLSRAIAERPAAATLTIYPSKVAAAAGAQAAPVNVSGSHIVAANAPARPASAAKPPTELQVVKTKTGTLFATGFL